MSKKRVTLAESIAQFLNFRAATSSAAHVATMRSLLGLLIDHYGNRPVASITEDDMARYMAFLRRVDTRFVDHPFRNPEDGKLSAWTIQAHYRTLNNLFNWIVKRHDRFGLKTNPMLEIPRPKVHTLAERGLTWSEFTRLTDACDTQAIDGRRDKALLYFLLDTGARAAGAYTLLRSSLDLPGLPVRAGHLQSAKHPIRSSYREELTMKQYTNPPHSRGSEN